jgi:hypothetical protein
MRNLDESHTHKKAVTVFGNEIVEEDSLAVSLVPELKRRLPDVNFILADPTENMTIPEDEWTILDVALGIDDVVVIEDLSQLEHVKGQSVHDYDVYMELRLREKIGELPKMKIVLVPSAMNPKEALEKVVELLQ